MNNVEKLDQIKAIITLVMYAVEANELEQVLERIAQASRDLVNARYAALGVPDGHGGLRYFKTAGMTPEQIRKMDHLPEGHGLIGAMMYDRSALRLDDIADDPRSSGFPEGHPHMARLLSVPIQLGQQLFGVIYLTDREDGLPFDSTDQTLVETMAGYAALAIAGAELHRKQNKLKLLEERERIAMELHDGVIQSLYAIGMHLDLIRTSDNFGPDAVLPIIHDLNDVIEDIRHYISELQHRDTRHRTIRQSLNAMLDRLHVPESLEIQIDAPQAKSPFSPAKFESVCLIINEAISNAVRHSDASLIELNAQVNETQFIVTIKDNGRGFALSDVQQKTGLGLRNMQQRARIYGGQVEIQSHPGHGTELVINIPVWPY